MNASNVSAPRPTTAPQSISGFSMTESTAIAMLASSAVGAIIGLIAVTCVLVAVTKQLERLVRVLRGEASVHTGLLACSVPPPDAFAGPGPSNNGGVSVSMSSGSASGKSILKKPIARLPTLTKHEKSRRPKTDENNTSCAIAEVDEEEDHTL